jgi:hypothetical protein
MFAKIVLDSPSPRMVWPADTVRRLAMRFKAKISAGLKASQTALWRMAQVSQRVTLLA